MRGLSSEHGDSCLSITAVLDISLVRHLGLVDSLCSTWQLHLSEGLGRVWWGFTLFCVYSPKASGSSKGWWGSHQHDSKYVVVFAWRSTAFEVKCLIRHAAAIPPVTRNNHVLKRHSHLQRPAAKPPHAYQEAPMDFCAHQHAHVNPQHQDLQEQRMWADWKQSSREKKRSRERKGETGAGGGVVGWG